ncbi:MAG: ABC transporter permease [Chloroflexota bacterium]
MAQIYVPDNPRERAQLEQPGRGGASQRQPSGAEPAERRFGTVDLLVAVAVLAAGALLVAAASRWTAPLTPVVHIDLSARALPVYAGYSLLRMLLAYILSLAFTLIYGHIAAANRQAAAVMVPVLDILQSIPILSFLPAVVLSLVALFPHSNIGLELASVILIFTGQAWNMTFSFYHSARSLPADLREFAALARLRPWQRFAKLELPAAAIGLLWNSMMSWAGGWFFLMAAEQFTLGSRSFQLPGLGSYLQVAANQGNTGALLGGLATLVALIVLLDVLVWRPLVAWADKFKVEFSSGGDAPTSPVLDALRRSSLTALTRERLFRPAGRAMARLLNRLQPLPGQAEGVGQRPRRTAGHRVVGLLVRLSAMVFVLVGLVQLVRLLGQVDAAAWASLLEAAGATWLRTVAALAIGVAWTVPVGVAIGLSPRWSRQLQPVVQVVASIPATALFPILLIALVGAPGGLSLAAVLLMLLGTQWYILFNVIAGAMAIPSDLREAATVYHVWGIQRWRRLILPAIFPYLVTGMITASGGAWNASVVSEYVQFNNHTISTVGLGARIAAAANAGRFPELLAATLLMAVIVVALNRLIWRRLYKLAERRYTLA